MVIDKTRYSNRLTAYLKMYFPQVLGWFSEVTSPIAGDFLERWPSLQKVQKARPETLRKFFIQRHSCTLDNVDRRLEEIRSALTATHDVAVACSCSAAMLALVRICAQCGMRFSPMTNKSKHWLANIPISQS